MRDPWRALLREPRPVGAPPAGRPDGLLVAGAEAVAVVEGLVRPGLAGQPWVTLLAMAVMPVLLWRRSRPLTACLLGFGAAGLLSAVQPATGAADPGPSSMLVVVVLLYSLVRWGSGREIALGLAFVAAVVALGMATAAAGPPDLIGGILFLLLFVALAVVVRSRADLWERRRWEIRTEERLALARELHDTVAHHVSAIAVQAQAGGVVARAEPERAVRVLSTIEDEATRTLAEMRAMVRVLREGDREGYVARPGVADLPRLARPDGSPLVEVTLVGDLTDLPAPVDTALFRVAQEALTNALRHARGATRVVIDLRHTADGIRLCVRDDGTTQPGSAPRPGFGVTGMTERARLLGGSLTAGPAPEGGWVVVAVLPIGGAR